MGFNRENRSGCYFTPLVIIHGQIKGVRTRMFCLIIYLPCFDPCVLFSCLVFCSVSSSTERA